jgi:uncharacterized OB-fold protein
MATVYEREKKLRSLFTNPTKRGHIYGRGSLAEECKRCGTPFAYASAYSKRCPGKVDRSYTSAAKRKHDNIANAIRHLSLRGNK